LEQIFPFLGVRFISVNDRFDSKNNTGFTAGLDVAFKTFLHSLYSKDISFKVRNGRIAKAQKGEHLCKLAPYGYQKSKTEKNKLIIDEETAPIIRYVFELALNGLSQAKIAKRLNSEGIDTPLVHRKKKGTHKDRGWTAKVEVNSWTTANVGRILRDIRYTGTMVNGKRTQIAPLSKKSKAVPRDEWIVVANTHEGIVSQETFEAVQKLLPEIGVEAPNMENRTLFSGKVFCGHCGYALKRLMGKHHYFTCLSKVYISSERCFTDRIYEYDVKDVVLIAFKKYAELAIRLKDEIKTANKQSNAKQTDISEQLVKLAGKKHQLSEQRARLFEDFANNKISKEQYLESKSSLSDELDRITFQKTELENKVQGIVPVSETNSTISLLEKLNNIQEVTPELSALVNRITIYDSKRIEINFAFADEITRLCAFQETVNNEYTEVI